MLLPHEACTLRPVTFCVMSVFHVTSIHRVTAVQAAWWESCTVWTAWRLRDWWCCLTRAAWFYTAWLLLLPHQACTLSPENGFCLVLVYELRDDCVTDAAWLIDWCHGCTEAHEWGSGPASADTGLAWQLYCLDCVTGGAVAELGLSDQSAWQLRGWCCGHDWPAHPVLHTIYIVKCQALSPMRYDCVNAAAGCLIVYC